MSSPTVRDNPSESAFEAEVDGEVARATYRLTGETITFTHTIVPAELEGRGIGSALAKAGLEAAKERGLKVVPQCSFISGYINRHPEYQDLL